MTVGYVDMEFKAYVIRNIKHKTMFWDDKSNKFKDKYMEAGQSIFTPEEKESTLLPDDGEWLEVTCNVQF